MTNAEITLQTDAEWRAQVHLASDVQKRATVPASLLNLLIRAAETNKEAEYASKGEVRALLTSLLTPGGEWSFNGTDWVYSR